jgi:hypothetical protein
MSSNKQFGSVFCGFSYVRSFAINNFGADYKFSAYDNHFYNYNYANSGTGLLFAPNRNDHHYVDNNNHFDGCIDYVNNSYNGVSYNGVSDNGVSDNGVSDNCASDNCASDNGPTNNCATCYHNNDRTR